MCGRKFEDKESYFNMRNKYTAYSRSGDVIGSFPPEDRFTLEGMWKVKDKRGLNEL